MTAFWDQRYAREDYLFGVAPNAFLARQAPRLKAGWHALAIADGEGRNGVWLAEQGLSVHSVDSSAVAQDKARRLAAERGVELQLELVDLSSWAWPLAAYDVVVGIFIQFLPPEQRDQMFEHVRKALKPGGMVLLEGYRPKQVEYRTGGPSTPENLYTEELLRAAFAGFEIVELSSYDAEIAEGSAHCGMSALIDLVAVKPGA
ncbi:SAM-dependent methyltransferase [Xanthobacter variabilis]|uniref:SAM-dependent methyltransferase n=1 Tax=Xanthobacter variabilis TaxID=3119932 RepID=UPI00374F4C41